MYLLSSIEENEIRILNVELHSDYSSREGEQKKSRPCPPKLSPRLFFCYWSKWGQLLEISVQPWMPQWWLSLRLMHLIYLFGISEMLFSSQLGVPGPISCSVMSCTLAGSTLACFVGLWLRQGRSGISLEFSTPAPSSIGVHKLKKNRKSWSMVGETNTKDLYFPSFQAFHTVLPHGVPNSKEVTCIQG